MNPSSDPFETANNATLPPQAFWGEFKTDAWYCFIKKGQPKVAFDAGQHPIENRFTQIDLSINPLPEQNVTNAKATERHLIAEYNDWVKIVLPSLKAVGLSLKELNGKFVKIECVTNGKQYKNSAGETKDETVFRLAAVFADESACRADYFAAGNVDRRGGSTGPTEANAQPAATHQPATGNDAEKATALQFLTAIVKGEAKTETDPTKLYDKVGAKIAGYPLVSKYFTIQSPETVELIMQNLEPVKIPF